ncbi:MAG: Fe-S protein assembly co-chaperone HscB [Gammaproteobacteria bacterium]|nr:Fe-S protein assembly co-chaperone HscB [Gammaproteobacteria bacterium]
MTKDILTSNFFELFELPVSYDVDPDKIQHAYMTLQKQVHPDKFANASDLDKRISMQQASWLNEAQVTLKDPVLRAIYLLKLNAIDVNIENETTMDAGFLMQQLEMRERLEHIRKESDPLAVLDVIDADVRSKADDLMKKFAQAYQQDEIDDARELIRKLQFMQKAKKEINTLIADIEDEQMS